MTTHFTKLNLDWNAEPNAPDPRIRVQGDRLVLEFDLNSDLFPQFAEGQRGCLRFAGVSRYRMGATNDEGWYLGQCRFSGIAPAWGEFYEVTGDLLLSRGPTDWKEIGPPPASPRRHFLFYLRDDTFECESTTWEFLPVVKNRAD